MSERARALAQRILADAGPPGLEPGARLPTERDIAVRLGVSRSTVRSALAVLEADGRISREVGRGTFLRAAPVRESSAAGRTDGLRQRGRHAGDSGADDPGTGLADTGQSRADRDSGAGRADFAPADVMTIRRLVEPPAMSLVVAWATEADLAEMDRCVVGGDRAANFEEFEVWDLALHRTLMAASHSPLLIALYSVIEAARHGQVWGNLKRRSSSRERRGQYQADHRAIVIALRARDSSAAAEAMRVHLARVSEHFNASDPAAALTWR